MLTGVFERESRTRHQVLDGLGDEYLRGTGGSTDSGADVHGDPTDLAVDRLDLAGVEPGPDLETQRPNGVDDRSRAPHAARRAVERGEEPIPAVSISIPR